uniref:PAS domain-containing protein n=1 Tax=Plectus sambesii TaxID=2011161 RepID=A0A914W882_9BILA
MMFPGAGIGRDGASMEEARRAASKQVQGDIVTFVSLMLLVEAGAFVFKHFGYHSAGAFVLCYTGNVHFASSNFAAIFGFDAKGMKGKRIFDLMTAESATELQQAMSAQLLRAATPSQGGISEESERVHKFTVQTKADGADRPSRKALLVGRFRRVECSPGELAAMAPTGVALNPTSDVLCLVGVGRPLARRGERHLFVEDCRNAHARQFMLVFNTDWTCIEADAAATHITGYTRTELLGTSGFDYCHVDDLENVVVEHRQLMVNGVWHSRPERFLTKAGQWVWLRCDATMERDVATNEPRRIRCIYSIASRDSLLRPPSSLSNVGLLSTVHIIDRSDDKDLKRKLQPAAYIEQYPIPAKRQSLTPTNSLPAELAATSVFSSPLHRRVWEQLQQTAHLLQQQICDKQVELQQLMQQASTVNSVASPSAANDVYSPQSGTSS